MGGMLALGPAARAAWAAPVNQRGAIERQGRAWVETRRCTVPAGATGQLTVRAQFGSIEVTAGTLDCEVVLRAYTLSKAEAQRLFRGFRLTVKTLNPAAVLIRSQSSASARAGERLSADFQIEVPAGFNLDLETGGGDISVPSSFRGSVRAITAGGNVRIGKVRGPVKIETSGGNITLGGSGSEVDARTAGGSIHAGNIAGDATLESSGGDITAGTIGGRARIETAGGDITLAGADKSVVAETSGGQIRLGQTEGDVRAETAGGSIILKGARGFVRVQTAGGSINLFNLSGAVHAETAAGSILAQLALRARNFQASQLETSSGGVTVYIPSHLPLTIRAQVENAAGHRIVSDFPLTVEGASQVFAGRPLRAEGRLNGGGETLSIQTTGGGIEIRKLDAQTLEQLKKREDRFWKRWALNLPGATEEAGNAGE